MAEMQSIEWKSKWKDDFLEWICGFANAQGGKIFIGCDDNGSVVGVENSRKLLEDIPNKIRNAMGIVVDVNLLEQDGREYLEIVVPPYPVAISCKGAYFYRSGSTMQKLSGPELESFILRKRGASWDNMPLPGFSTSDIDDGLVEKFKAMAAKKGRIDHSVLDESKESLMEKLRLTNVEHYTNAAMLLFSKDPDRWQLGAYTKIGFFESDADLRYQDEIHGSILEQIDQIIEVLHLKYMKAMISYEGIQRVERYFVPDEALREALLNALCHKQYESCTPIQISVYEDKLFIANCGRLPENWTADNLMSKHASRPYNPSIANAFYLAGLIESWGRGVEKICQACEADGHPRPRYSINPGDIMIEFRAFSEDSATSKRENDTANVVENVVANVVVNDSVKLTKSEQTVRDYLKQHPYATILEVAGAIKKASRTVDRAIFNLKKKGILTREGSDKAGRWVILK